ncbi:hypothetical protein V6N13_001656 [Hibiscus sabdariffa]
MYLGKEYNNGNRCDTFAANKHLGESDMLGIESNEVRGEHADIKFGGDNTFSSQKNKERFSQINVVDNAHIENTKGLRNESVMLEEDISLIHDKITNRALDDINCMGLGPKELNKKSTDPIQNKSYKSCWEKLMDNQNNSKFLDPLSNSKKPVLFVSLEEDEEPRALLLKLGKKTKVRRFSTLSGFQDKALSETERSKRD